MSQNNTQEIATDSYTASEGRTRCSLISSSIAASFSIFFFNTTMILVGCKIAHFFLQRFGQHRLVSDFVIGILIGNVGVLRSTIEEHVILYISRIGGLSFSFYLFVLGLELEPKEILRWSSSASKIAQIGIISTIGSTILSFLLITRTIFKSTYSIPVISGIAVCLASTSSPILTRLIAELKINKSEIGRLAVRTALTNDMLCTAMICLGVALFSTYGPYKDIGTATIRAAIHILFISFEAWIISKLINPLIRKLNDRNPDGKPIRDTDMIAVTLICAILCYCSLFFGFNPSFNAFVVGLCIQREGRMSSFLIGRINFILTTIMLPLYLVLIGITSDYKSLMEPGKRSNAYNLMVVGSIGAMGKMTGTVAYSITKGLQWQEAVAFGFLLNVKGYLHIFCGHIAMVAGVIDTNTMIATVLLTVASVIPTPIVVSFIVRRARARAMARGPPMGLQWCNSSGEVRILVGLHGPDEVPMAVNVMEAIRGPGNVGGLVAFVVDMVEMTAKTAATLVHGQGMEAVTVADEAVVEIREQIGSALEAFAADAGDCVRLRRLLAVSSFDNMHEDICSSAQDCRVALIVLPFHRRQRVDGAMDGGHPGYRIVNQKVLQSSPCSVAIIVNRGLSRGLASSLSTGSQNACAVFIGGADDREALAYASMMSHHPGVRLTVIRFIVDDSVRNKFSGGPGRRVLTAVEKRETERRIDDEFFAGFYEAYVAGGRGVGCVEKRVESGVETVAALRAVEGQYHVFIVGRGKERDSVLTAGMSEWAECPELGPIGDILAASDLSLTASVIVIQQHNAMHGYDVIDEEFLPL